MGALVSNFSYGNNDLMVICAFRYCLGRRSYIVANCVEWLVKEWNNFNPKVHEIIAKELDEAFLADEHSRANPDEIGSRLGSECDVNEWRKVKALYTKPNKTEPERLLEKWMPVLTLKDDGNVVPEHLYEYLAYVLEVQTAYFKNPKNMDFKHSDLLENLPPMINALIYRSFVAACAGHSVCKKKYSLSDIMRDTNWRKFKPHNSFRITFDELKAYNKACDEENQNLLSSFKDNKVVKLFETHLASSFSLYHSGYSTAIQIKPSKTGIKVLVGYI